MNDRYIIEKALNCLNRLFSVFFCLYMIFAFIGCNPSRSSSNLDKENAVKKSPDYSAPEIETIKTTKKLTIEEILMQEKTQAKESISQILKTQKAILEHLSQKDESCHDCEFWAVWDFDGTILDGDCTEGLFRDDRFVYTGLAQRAVEAGLSKNYRGPHAAGRLMKDYTQKMNAAGGDHLKAYTFMPQVFAGSEIAPIKELANKAFAETYRNYFFKSSVTILNELAKNNIRNIIISASPDFFVEGARALVPVGDDDFHGIEMGIKGGKITDEIIAPITYAQGKTEKLKGLRHKALLSGKQVFIIAGFGNSFSTDGPFLRFILEEGLQDTSLSKKPALPMAIKPFASMINAGMAPPEYQGLFLEIVQSIHN